MELEELRLIKQHLLDKYIKNKKDKNIAKSMRVIDKIIKHKLRSVNNAIL